MSNPEFHRLLARAKMDVEASAEIVNLYRASKDLAIEKLAPSLSQRLLQSRQATEQALTNADPKIRAAGLVLMDDYWGPDKKFAPVCKRLAFEDPVSFVRGAAIRGLFRCAFLTKDAELMRFLEAIEWPTSELPQVDQNLMQLAVDLKEAAARETALVAKSQRERMQKLAGPMAERMYQSPQVAYANLRHADANVRMAALTIMTYHWGPNKDFAVECERMALTDPDPNVRAHALVNWSTCFAKTDDPRVGKVFAQIVLDESQYLECRKSAYFGLFEVRGMPLETRPLFRLIAAGRSADDFHFPEDVDFSFVDSFLEAPAGG